MAKGPLAGVKVIEYCENIAGPFCGKQFSDQGAEVIKIERPWGDSERMRGPFYKDVADPEHSSGFLFNNTNKKSITLNLEAKTAREIFKKLIAEADILIEDTKPGTLESLGLGYETLREINPGLIMASITPFGQTGPYRDYKAYYLNTFHGCGAGYLLPADSPNTDREPIKMGGSMGESDIGLCAATAILGAYYWREFGGGTGQYIDISKQEAEMAIERQNLMLYFETGKSKGRTSNSAVRDILITCGDGGCIKIVLLPEKQWLGLCRALGDPEWTKMEMFSTDAKRIENYQYMKEYLTEAAKDYTAYEMFAKIQAEGTACAPVCSAKQVYESPQNEVREFFVEMDHPVVGKRLYPGLPYITSTAPITDNTAAPLLGQHNEEILCGRLGYTVPELAKLKEAGAV
ncbi:MAG: CaiB/BaiF CoA transferase family protein [Oscillospiraceae bacterium]